jgi:hypothetical protein
MRRPFLLAQLAPLMRILFDHGTPSGIVKALLELAEAAEFDILLTTDKGIRYQQNLQGRKIAIVVLGNSTWRVVCLYLGRIASAVNAVTPRSYAEVEIPYS